MKNEIPDVDSPMETLPRFRHYQLSLGADEGVLEMGKSDSEMACAAFDARSGFFVEIHILSNDLGRATPSAKTFLDLVETATAVRHRNVLPVLDAGIDEGTPYYVTGLADGESLRDYIDRCAPVPDAVALGIALDLVSGLQGLSNQAPSIFPYAEPSRLRIILEPPELVSPDVLLVRGVLADLGLSRVPLIGESAKRSEEQYCALIVELLREMLGGGSFTTRRELADAKTLNDLSVRLAARLKELGGREAVSQKFIPRGAFGQMLLAPKNVEASVEGLRNGEGHGIDGWRAMLDDVQPIRVREVPGASFCEEPIYETAARAANTHHAFPVSCFIEQDGRLLVAEKTVANSLASLIAERGSFSGREFMWLVQSLDRALEEAAEGGRRIWSTLPEMIGISGNFEALHLRQAPTLSWLSAPYRYFEDGHFPEFAAESAEDGERFLQIVRSLPLSEIPDGLVELLGSAPIPQAAGAGRGGLINRIALFVEPVDGELPEQHEGTNNEPGVAETLFREEQEGSAEGWNPVAREVLRGEKIGLEEEVPEEEERSKLGFFLWMLLLVILLAAAALGLTYYFGYLDFGVPRALPV